LISACKLNDHISIEIWDWDRIGSDDFEGYVEFDLKDLMPGPTPVIELTLKLKPKKDLSDNVTGSITMDIGFRRTKKNTFYSIQPSPQV